MAGKARNVVPALKDRRVSKFITLNAMPAVSGGSALMYVDPVYDLEVVRIQALVTGATTAAASPFTLGYTAYTDSTGTIQPAAPAAFLPASLCLDGTGQSFSTGILPVGTIIQFVPPSNASSTLTPILPAGSALILVGTSTANTGQIFVTVSLRPKDKQRGDASKRPGGSSDYPYSF